MAESKQVDKSKYRYFGAVINGQKESLLVLDDLAGLRSTLHETQGLYYFIATIIHDKDTFTIDDEKAGRGKAGAPKREHLHAFIDLGEGAEKKTPGQMVNELTKALKIERIRISVSGSNNGVLLCQYLTHQNHPEKAQYKAELVRTSSEPLLEEILAKKYEAPKSKEDQEAEIFEAILDARTLIELSTKIGIEKANKYRPIFKEIKQEQRQDYEALITQRHDLLTDLSVTLNRYMRTIDLLERGALTADDIEDAKGIIAYYTRRWRDEFNGIN